MDSFKQLNLSSSLLNALEDMGMEQPTSIQSKAFPVIMSGVDVVGIAQTGTGKTFAYLLPSLRLWKFVKDPYPQILIIVPTRELVVQVYKEVKKLTKYMNVVCLGVYGGVNMKPQKAAVEQGCDVIVGTPGRLMDLALSGSLKLKNIKRFIIDEMDEMLELGFRTQIKNIIEMLPEKRQNLMFSATITDEVTLVINDYFNNPVTIEAARAGTPLEGIEQMAYNIPNFNTKIFMLEWLLTTNESMNKVLIFVGSKKLADDVFEDLSLGFENQVAVIHSNKAQNKRFEAVEAFEKGKKRILIATDIVARGIDIASVSHVINFDLPEQPEHYIHRIGRTGRADQRGIAISFITPKDNEAQLAIETLMEYKIPMLPFPDEVIVSDQLREDELPKKFVPNITLKLPKLDSGGGAFHEKKAKNLKVNIKVSHKEKMMKKYGKPKKRSSKK
jgi:ATP-dependent RNA helicase RhlE